MLFVVGIVIGSFIAARLLSAEQAALLPSHYHSAKGAVALLAGGVLVGFGTRYAGGCTSGHAIMGMSGLNWPSLVATLSFFAGGLSAVWGYQTFFGPEMPQ